MVLRAISEDDYDDLFEQQRDPDSVWMAAFTPADPGDRLAFDARMANIAGSADAITRAVTYEDRLVGSIASFVADGATEITYWIERSFWGRGIASQALALFLDEVSVRPIKARAASDNARSLRILEKAGFHALGTEVSFAAARGVAIEETILELPAPFGAPRRAG